MRDRVKQQIREAIRAQYPEGMVPQGRYVFNGRCGISLRYSTNHEVELGLGLYKDGSIKFYVHSHGAHERVSALVHQIGVAQREGLGFFFSEPDHETDSCMECYFARQMDWRHLLAHDMQTLVADYAAIVLSLESVGAFA